jgi:hypothetical protein
MEANKRLVQRYPLAWGITKWGPLPDTPDMWILWGGPGDHLELFTGDPAKMGSTGRRIRHSAASGLYCTVTEAEKAVNAFVAAGIT